MNSNSEITYELKIVRKYSFCDTSHFAKKLEVTVLKRLQKHIYSKLSFVIDDICTHTNSLQRQ